MVVEAKGVHLEGRVPPDHPRFLAANFRRSPRWIYEEIHSARGNVKNCIKEVPYGIAINRHELQSLPQQPVPRPAHGRLLRPAAGPASSGGGGLLGPSASLVPSRLPAEARRPRERFGPSPRYPLVTQYHRDPVTDDHPRAARYRGRVARALLPALTDPAASPPRATRAPALGVLPLSPHPVIASFARHRPMRPTSGHPTSRFTAQPSLSRPQRTIQIASENHPA